MEELRGEKKKLEAQIKQLEGTIEKKDIEIAAIKLEATSKGKLVADMNEAVGKMKRGYAEMEDELAYQKRTNERLRKEVDVFHA